MVLVKMWCFLLLLFASVIFNSLQYKFNIDCMDGSDKGAHYKGKVNITETGAACINWSTGPYADFKYLDGNFCRNPDNSMKTWCFVSKTPKAWGNCNVSYCGYVCPDLKPTEHMIHPTNLVVYKLDDIVNFICKIGYTLIGNKTSVCRNTDGRQPMAQWTNKQPSCRAVDCTNINLDAHVQSSTKIPKYNDIVTLSCMEGYVGAPLRIKCYANGSWPTYRPICTPITCKGLNLDAHVKSSIQMPKYKDNVTLSCKEGYNGEPSIIKCYTDGTWPSDRPNCTSITCNILTVDDNVMKSQNISKYNDNVTLSCKEGYNGTSVILKCNSNGVWPSQRPYCTAITCNILTVDDNIMKSQNISKYNDNVTLSCKEGYNGTSVILNCNSYGVWPSQRPYCTVVPCPAINNTKHMIRPKHISGYQYGDYITFQCINGYILSGPSFITCRGSRNNSIVHWSDHQPLCLAVTCHNLRVVPHQRLEPVQMKYSYRDHVTFKCNDGYELTSADTITCQKDGTWSNKQPNCTGVPCPHLPHIYKALLTNRTKEYRYPETVNITCEVGYVVDSSDLLRCNSSGFWNSIPQCTCKEKSQSYKDSIVNRGKCISYGLFGGVLATVVSMSAGVHIAMYFYYRKRAREPAAVYEDMQFNTVERQNSNTEETYTELK